jgi:hypothetical protein
MCVSQQQIEGFGATGVVICGLQGLQERVEAGECLSSAVDDTFHLGILRDHVLQKQLCAGAFASRTVSPRGGRRSGVAHGAVEEVGYGRQACSGGLQPVFEGCKWPQQQAHDAEDRFAGEQGRVAPAKVRRL